MTISLGGTIKARRASKKPPVGMEIPKLTATRPHPSVEADPCMATASKPSTDYGTLSLRLNELQEADKVVVLKLPDPPG